MSRVSDAPRQTTTNSTPRTRHVCPFCGTLNESAIEPCAKCTMMNTPQTRRVTRGRIGPWYVMQSRNPAAPGMKFDVLVAFIRKGQVTARSIVRGPTTHQFWRYAAHVKGLSREFGLCYSCGVDIATESHLCPHCGKIQEPPADVDALLEAATNSPTRAAVAKLGAVGNASARSVPDMVDAEVVPDLGHTGDPSDSLREATRVVIEPIIEVTPQLAEPEDEPDVLTADDLNKGKTERTPSSNSVVEDGAAAVGTPAGTAEPGQVQENGVYHARSVGSTSTALMSPADIEAAFHMKFAPVAEFFEEQVTPPRSFTKRVIPMGGLPT
jgi:predicted RNA-binding Zn-ribbon protein involved in translation (DUF1610 family)